MNKIRRQSNAQRSRKADYSSASREHSIDIDDNEVLITDKVNLIDKNSSRDVISLLHSFSWSSAGRESSNSDDGFPDSYVPFSRGKGQVIGVNNEVQSSYQASSLNKSPHELLLSNKLHADATKNNALLSQNIHSMLQRAQQVCMNVYLCMNECMCVHMNVCT